MKKRKIFLFSLIFILIALVILITVFNNAKETQTSITGISATYASDKEVNLSKDKTTEIAENNSKVLQQAINELSNNGGGTIKIPSGTYYFAPIAEIGEPSFRWVYAIECKNNVKIVGAGTDEKNSNSCTILKPFGKNLEDAFTMFNYIGDSGVYLENADFSDFIIDGNETLKAGDYSTQGKGFNFRYFKDCDWNNVIVRNTDGTGFGMDGPINSTVTNCIAINCGKKAEDKDVGASGFGIGTGFSEEESMKISNSTAIGNRKFGFFFEHQGRFGTGVNAKKAKGFLVTDCVARGNMYDFGGERANDVIYRNCVAEKIKDSDPSPLREKNETSFYFGTNSRNIHLINCSTEFTYENIVDTSADYYKPVIWAANNSIIDCGESKPEYKIDDEAYRSSVITMLWRFAGRPGDVLLNGEQLVTGYDDVPSDSWYADAVAWAYKSKIIDGGTTFDAAADYNRGDFITMLWKFAGSPIVNTGNDYLDIPEGASYENAVNWALNKNLIEYTSDNFNAATPCLNSDILTILYKYNSTFPQNVVIYDYWQNGGKNSDKVYEVKKQNENIDLSVKAEKEGCDFIGWSTNKDATTGLSSLKMDKDSIYLYAIWDDKNEAPVDDDTIPTLNVEYNKEVKWFNTDIELIITASDAESGIDTVTVNGEPITLTNGKGSYMVKQNGTYKIVATDKDGNTATHTVKITRIDKTVPVISKLEANSSGDEVNISITDNESGTDRIEYSFDGQNWNDILNNNRVNFVVSKYSYKKGESTALLKIVQLDTDTIYIRAFDGAGNVTEVKSVTLNTDSDDNNPNTPDNPNNPGGSDDDDNNPNTPDNPNTPGDNDDNNPNTPDNPNNPGGNGNDNNNPNTPDNPSNPGDNDNDDNNPNTPDNPSNPGNTDNDDNNPNSDIPNNPGNINNNDNQNNNNNNNDNPINIDTNNNSNNNGNSGNVINNSNTSNNGTSNNNSSGDSPIYGGPKDGSSTEPLPQTGVRNTFIIVSIIFIAIVAIIIWKKLKNLNEIK